MSRQAATPAAYAVGSLQAMVFGFMRADAPHLQLEARKVRKRGIGDIDAWEGDRLVISAEVKHYV